MGESVRSPNAGPERKHPRFPLRCPVQLRFEQAGKSQEMESLSRNVSLGGVLLDAPTPLPADCAVEFVMSLPTAKRKKVIHLKGTGRVIRIEQDASGTFGIAVQCTRPMHQVIEAVGRIS
jgi:PilZ domain